jgi:hypothetical protein
MFVQRSEVSLKQKVTDKLGVGFLIVSAWHMAGTRFYWTGPT